MIYMDPWELVKPVPLMKHLPWSSGPAAVEGAWRGVAPVAAMVAVVSFTEKRSHIQWSQMCLDHQPLRRTVHTWMMVTLNRFGVRCCNPPTLSCKWLSLNRDRAHPVYDVHGAMSTPTFLSFLLISQHQNLKTVHWANRIFNQLWLPPLVSPIGVVSPVWVVATPGSTTGARSSGPLFGAWQPGPGPRVGHGGWPW